MGKKICLFWDIDGTLIWSGGAGERAFEHATREVYGIETSLTKIDYSGRTDRLIARLIADYHEIEEHQRKDTDILAAYLKQLSVEMNSGTAFELKGVRQLLGLAHADDSVEQGLLTGNLIEGAETKLRHFDFWKYFHFGGFADHSHERDQIAEHALELALKKDYAESAELSWVIGDTPHDVSCGRHIGARTLAVTTGKHTVDELRLSKPDIALESLEDVETVWKTLID